MKPKNKEKFVILFITAALAWNYPLLSLFSRDWFAFDIPALYLYVFLVWIIIIILVAFAVERSRPRSDDMDS